MHETAIITVYYKDRQFTSIPIALPENSHSMKLVMTLLEQGADGFPYAFKLPMETEAGVRCVVFSKDQLKECLFDIVILQPEVEDNEPKPEQ